jgi:hypothetical protein
MGPLSCVALKALAAALFCQVTAASYVSGGKTIPQRVHAAGGGISLPPRKPPYRIYVRTAPHPASVSLVVFEYDVPRKLDLPATGRVVTLSAAPSGEWVGTADLEAGKVYTAIAVASFGGSNVTSRVIVNVGN